MNKFFHSDSNSNKNKGDKLYKIRFLFNYLPERWRKFYIPSKEICIDESIIKFDGRISFKQYIKNKPIKFGLKAFLLCDNTGYCTNFLLYCGQNNEFPMDKDTVY